MEWGLARLILGVDIGAGRDHHRDELAPAGPDRHVQQALEVPGDHVDVKATAEQA